MALIFCASGDVLSHQRTSRFLGPLLYWLLPFLSQASLDVIEFCVRKTGHLTEYGVLALLLWRAMRKPVQRDLRPWSWHIARLAWLGTILYAATDELHQLFVPTRQSMVEDVGIDALGAGLALLLLWTIGRWRKHW